MKITKRQLKSVIREVIEESYLHGTDDGYTTDQMGDIPKELFDSAWESIINGLETFNDDNDTEGYISVVPLETKSRDGFIPNDGGIRGIISFSIPYLIGSGYTPTEIDDYISSAYENAYDAIKQETKNSPISEEDMDDIINESLSEIDIMLDVIFMLNDDGDYTLQASYVDGLYRIIPNTNLLIDEVWDAGTDEKVIADGVEKAMASL